MNDPNPNDRVKLIAEVPRWFAELLQPYLDLACDERFIDGSPVTALACVAFACNGGVMAPVCRGNNLHRPSITDADEAVGSAMQRELVAAGTLAGTIESFATDRMVPKMAGIMCSEDPPCEECLAYCRGVVDEHRQSAMEGTFHDKLESHDVIGQLKQRNLDDFKTGEAT